MAQTYHAQTKWCPPTMTVGELIKQLQQFKPDELVIFKTPLIGTFGSNTAYSIEQVKFVVEPRREHIIPASSGIDEEGFEFSHEEELQIFEAWQGVVIE